MSGLILVPTLAQPASSLHDEPAVFAQALLPADMATLYVAGQTGINSDPQGDLGLEELYGTDQPHDVLTPPLLANGLCRVRWAGPQAAFVLDAFAVGVGYQEAGRVTVWGDDTTGPAAGIYQYTTVLAAELVRYTPELAVVQVSMGAVVAGQVYRADVYIRVGRGWAGPRFEVYPARRAGVALGAHLRYSPYYTDVAFGVVPGTIGAVPFFGVSDEGGWAGNANPPVTENWLVYGGQARSLSIAVLRTAVKYRSYVDSVAYGVARNSLAVAADQAVAAVAGYVTAKYGYSAARAPVLEAEAYVNAGGTRTSVADGTAGGGNAVNDTQTSGAANTMALTAAQLARIPVGKYGVWARVRVTTGGDTGTVQAVFGAGGAVAATFTSTTYVWVYLGEAVHAAGADTFGVAAWRSAGVGTTGMRLDRILLAPTERRQAADATYDGARDNGQELLFDSRAVPEIVAR